MTLAQPPLELVTVAILPEGCFSVLKWRSRPVAVSVERTFEPTMPAERREELYAGWKRAVRRVTSDE